MKLNLGCGSDLRDGHINIDIRDCGADLTCDIRQLPYPSGSVTDILALDILEHFPASQTRPLLTEWHRVLKPGGSLTVRVPNLHAIAHQMTYWGQRPGPQLDALIANIYGGHKWAGDTDAHHTGWTPESLKVLLSDSGFVVRDNDLGLNQTVTATRG